MNAKAERRRGGGPRALAATLPAITRPLFGKRGFANGAILTDWPAIAGELLARHSLPERVAYPAGARAGGTLHLRIDSGAMAIELHHLKGLSSVEVSRELGRSEPSVAALLRRGLKRLRTLMKSEDEE